MVVISELSGASYLKVNWRESLRGVTIARAIALLAADLAIFVAAITQGHLALSEMFAAWVWLRYGRPSYLKDRE